jgi:hypothetical protein
MATEQDQQDAPEAEQDQQDAPEATEKPEVTDEHREKAKEMRKEYEEERPTVVMPGTDGAVSGTAVNDWIDDDGNPKFAKEDGGESTDATNSDSDGTNSDSEGT